MAEQSKTVHVRGEGGHIIEMDLPIPAHYAKRFERGELVIVNADGSPVDDDAPARPARKRSAGK
jgi:hypothetical protein